MKVTLIQTHLEWENREKNLLHFDLLINSITQKTDLIILPEMFTTGFTMQPNLFADASNGETLTWLKEKAIQKNAVITGSVAVQENSFYYNRLFWVCPNGESFSYDKRHLFSMANENLHYTAGTKKIFPTINEWKFCPLICYDLRFPVWSRNKKIINKSDNLNFDYDVLIYVANWPEVRSYVWKNLLIARAIENYCYVIGVNRIGKDGNRFEHIGDSVVINPRGEIISNINPNEESVFTIELDKNYLEEFRENFPVGNDADNFLIY